ncbi:uncharacterized protein ACNLHF_003362 isoform 1-T1 [Anomaloglossus baeobatrachus]|uniref:uncharacterized protein LOC142258513 isoform X1 n=1 Tax=Anomaloglossus baeobatrachus TaxID=238106 RepID=UPI003F50A8A1
MDKVCPAGIGGPPKHCALLIALYLSALILPGNSQDPQLRITQEALPLQSNSLALALGELLEYNHDAGLTVEKKAVQVPRVRSGYGCLRCMDSVVFRFRKILHRLLLFCGITPPWTPEQMTINTDCFIFGPYLLALILVLNPSLMFCDL